MKLLELTKEGLYCPQAGVYIDPWRAVNKAIITHAHSDHARWGMKSYLAHHHSREVLRLRLGKEINLQTVSYSDPIEMNGVKVSLHPAGHIPGSSQVRLEYKGHVSVVSGDYKVMYDGLSEEFEPIKCHDFVSECTFGMPVYKWESPERVNDQINTWWSTNAKEGRNSVIFAYSLGKAQRVLQNLDLSIGEVLVHGAVWNTNQALIANGLPIHNAAKVEVDSMKSKKKGVMVIAPPSAFGTPWMKKFLPYRTGICSGWMAIRGNRRRRSADQGFVLSDHADWDGLVSAITSTGAENVYLTHGNTASFSRFLNEEKGINAMELETLFGEEETD